MENKLKKCPFCGSDGATAFNTEFGFQAFCTNDDCILNELLLGGFDTEEEVMEKWNTRV